MRSTVSCLFVLLTGMFFLSPASAEHWYQFLGPTGESRSASKKLPVEWSEEKNIKWKTPIHGRGWSSPVELEGRIWMGTATPDGHEMYAICVDAETGKIIHDIKLFDVAEPREIHKLNSYASPTPILEPGRAYMHFGSYGTACLDAETGKKIWERTDLPCHHWRGPGSSPIIEGDKLIIHYDGYDYQYIIAMNKNTGETIWKKDRAPYIDFHTDNGDMMKAYCTPIVVEQEGRKLVISPAAKATVAYDLETGEEVWKLTYKEHSATAKPIYRDGTFFINTGFGKAKLISVKEGGHGDITDTHVNWIQAKSVPSKPTPILVNGLIFMIHDQGVATCLDAETGEIVWQERVSGNYSSSPLYANGNIYVFAQDGKATVFKAAREFQIVAENQLDSGFMASPAVVGDDLVLRTETHLYRIGK
ncbi:MAG: PQQ-like beta-propeller repeat protein [Planctomycetaceae bacterium]|nr:PQQ-like beta-propeller repeat protein [Planctomycetaceae bacterium]